MAVPNIQIMVNADRMRVFWDFDPVTYSAYNVYYDTAANMAAEALISKVTNEVGSYFSKTHVVFEFKRSTLGIAENTTMYLRIKGILRSTGSEDAGNPGATKYVPAVSDKIPTYNPVQLQGFDGNVWRSAAADTSGRLDTV